MEISPLLSTPLSLGVVPYYGFLRRFPIKACSEPAAAEDTFVPLLPSPQTATPEPNFRVDDLLDFSHEDEEDLQLVELTEETVTSSISSDAAQGTVFTTIITTSNNDDGEQQQIASNDATSVSTLHETSDGLCVPPDELSEQLEWLSAFNEDSSYSGDRNLASLVSSGNLRVSIEEGESSRSHDMFQTPSPVSVLETSSSCHISSGGSVPSRARSKRARAATRIWSLDTLIPTLVENRLGGGQESPVFFGCSPVSQPVSKKPKKASPIVKMASALAIEAPPRRCTHCLVQKTPQWRAGPLGPKTLCNACGVRYKSGRLLPEYRPAGSPTFVSEVHSNSHKRILEMRRMKEAEEQQQQYGNKHLQVMESYHQDEEEEDEDEEEFETEDVMCQTTDGCHSLFSSLTESSQNDSMPQLLSGSSSDSRLPTLQHQKDGFCTKEDNNEESISSVN